MKKKIGKVIIYGSDGDTADTYKDSAEDILLKLFKKNDYEKQRAEILNNKPTWALYYHLNKYRENLIKWYEFKEGASVLEIGAGCGAITEALVRKNIEVTALELSHKRATINALRNKQSENLNIVVDNIENYSPNKKFDYIICVGVLEYSGTFINADSPYDYFLDKIARLLKKKGTCLLAIENRFGLKYWSGAKEDHVPALFEGHNGYPSPKRVQTFGRKELANLFHKANFKNTYFYYPFPDYKNPLFVYSDSFYPGNGTVFPLRSLPTHTSDREREYFFSEQSAMINIEANDLFPEFSNSFLIEGGK